MNLYREAGGKKLRCGCTTGSCAAAAAKAAAWMLRSGREIHSVHLKTPGGTELCLEVLDIRMRDGAVRCAVQKDAGDDPDVTDGVLIYAEVSYRASPGVEIRGGEGVGRVTRPGLDQPVGSAAINSTPRRMIEEAVLEAAGMRDADEKESGAKGPGAKSGVPPAGERRIGAAQGFRVVISIPGGEKLAEKTFNPKLGIAGGLSVLGTSGIVEPMSDEAMVRTIEAEIRVRMAEHFPILPVAPGNYGRNFLLRTYGFPLDLAAECSNFAADTVAMAADAGFRKLLLTGHIGKLVKIAGGMRNTHSRCGDHRMEITAELVRQVAPDGEREEICKKIMECAAMDEAVHVLRAHGIDRPLLTEMAERVKRQMEDWSEHRLAVEVVMFSNRYGALGVTRRAEAWMEILKAFRKR